MHNWISRLRRQFRRRGPPGGASPALDVEWQRIAGLSVARVPEANQVSIRPDRNFQKIKLRSLGSDIDIYRWILEFHDGTILDLSVNLLLEGCESSPMRIAGRRLKRVLVRFDGSRVTRRGRLEIWAQP
jgi:hypothetical protein